jgi:hypothetical protein
MTTSDRIEILDLLLLIISNVVSPKPVLITELEFAVQKTKGDLEQQVINEQHELNKQITGIFTSKVLDHHLPDTTCE